MEMPNVNNPAIDSRRGVKYNVKAYRKLTEGELSLAIHMYLKQAKPKPKRGSTVTIVSLIGGEV